MSRIWATRVIAVAALVVAIAAVLFVAVGPDFMARLFGPTYDGWKVGDVDTCPSPNFDLDGPQPTSGWDCAASLAVWLTAGREGLDRRDANHPLVTKATLHHSATSTVNLANCCEIVVFELADGSVRAIGVAHLGVDYSRVASIDYGPD